MNTLDTLYFPDTVLPLYQQLPLALFFHSVHLLQPVEQEGKEEQDASLIPGSHLFTETGFCQEHTPLGLGVDRDRFLHLLHDIRNRKDNYVEQLNYLSLASLSAPPSRGDNSKLTIISSLLQGMDKDAEGHDEALWQARLVLKIAEVLDREEEELAQQLAAIDDEEIALFRSLQGEIRESGDEDVVEEDPFIELLELKQKMNQPRPGMIKNRLRAWSRLFLSGPLPDNFCLWTTRRQEAADILLEKYEQECGQAPILLLQIDLPARISQENAEAVREIEQFRDEMQAHLQELATALGELVKAGNLNVSDPASLLPQAETWKEVWNSKLESSFPASQYGRTPLTLHLLAEMPFSELIGEPRGIEMKSPARRALLAVCV
ncbi:MAG: hypothetical protein Q7U88_10400 [Desulfocapsaceae bacterium]|nr:hypothetical protein [Desulfocapsaceae bacterium]